MKHHYVPFIRNPNALRLTKHPVFQLIGLRGAIAEHTEAEESMLVRYAQGRTTLVEIGVAEGASALALRCAVDKYSTLYLIDPYPSGKVPGLNFVRICARRHVGKCKTCLVHWIRDFSYNAAKSWNIPIDFLFIDGDHSYDGCLRDWQDWSRFVVRGGVVAFHDARVFTGGWTDDNVGSVKVVRELFRDRVNEDWEIVDEVDSLVIVRRVLILGSKKQYA